MRANYGDFDDHAASAESILFPATPAADPQLADGFHRRFTLTGLTESAGEVQDAIESMSRRIEDLARELNCLGFFGDDDGPRAA